MTQNKYQRQVPGTTIDVYDVLVAFNVTCPARAHAIKKLLCAGIRGKGDAVQDLTETLQAVDRALSLEVERVERSQNTRAEPNEAPR